MKCQACKEQVAEWAWQPFGPSESPDSFALLGSHYRGFPVVKVCGSCKSAFQSGDVQVFFSYKGHQFVGENHRVRERNISLYVDEGHSDAGAFAGHQARLLMRERPSGLDVAALVFEDNADILSALVIAPRLLEASQDVLAWREKLTWFLERGVEARRIEEEQARDLLMALASLQTLVDEAVRDV